MSDFSTFCPLPWNHISTTSSGSYRLCCSSDEALNKLSNENGATPKIYRDKFSVVRNSVTSRRVREEMLAGSRPKVCSPCFEIEDSRGQSPRLAYLNSFTLDKATATKNTNSDGTIDSEVFPIEYIDIRLGNHCNLRCRMCNSWSSSSWNEESQALFGTENVGLLDWPSKKLRWIEEVVSHSSVQEIYLTGGEPTLIDENIQLLKKLVSLGMSDIRIKINSNLVFLSPQFLETLDLFENTLFKCSIDGLGIVNDYIRFPSNFNDIERNLFLIKDRFDFEIQTTVQAYNIFSLGEWMKWCLETIQKRPDFYLLSEPDWLNIKKLNPSFKEVIKDRFERDSFALGEEDSKILKNILNEVSSQYCSFAQQDLKKYTKAMDNYRGQQIDHFIPELKML